MLPQIVVPPAIQAIEKDAAWSKCYHPGTNKHYFRNLKTGTNEWTLPDAQREHIVKFGVNAGDDVRLVKEYLDGPAPMPVTKAEEARRAYEVLPSCGRSIRPLNRKDCADTRPVRGASAPARRERQHDTMLKSSNDSEVQIMRSSSCTRLQKRMRPRREAHGHHGLRAKCPDLIAPAKRHPNDMTNVSM